MMQKDFIFRKQSLSEKLFIIWLINYVSEQLLEMKCSVATVVGSSSVFESFG